MVPDFDGAKARDTGRIVEGERHVGALDLDHADIGRRRGAGLLRRRRGAAITEKIIAAGGREEDDQGARDNSCRTCHSKMPEERRRVVSSPQAPATALCIALTWGCGGRKPSLWPILTQSCQSNGVGWAIALGVDALEQARPAWAQQIKCDCTTERAARMRQGGEGFLVAVPEELEQL